MERLHSTSPPLDRLHELLKPYALDEGLSRELDLDTDLGLESHSRVELFEELSSFVLDSKAQEALFQARTVGDLEDILCGKIPVREQKVKTDSSELDPPRNFLHLLYSAWVFSILVICFSITWVVNLLLPDQSLRRRATKAGCRIMCFLTGSRIKRSISGHLPHQGIFVCNHTSYVDVPIIYSTLPTNFCFVAKIELSRIPLIGFFFKRLGTQFVERFDVREARTGLLRMEEVLRTGDSLLFFSEGTFRETPGVLPFRSGAFLLAERFNLPIVPISLSGTREFLRAGRSWVRRVPISITVHDPIYFSGGLTLRQRKSLVRSVIASGAGEPLIEQI